MSSNCLLIKFVTLCSVLRFLLYHRNGIYVIQCGNCRYWGIISFTIGYVWQLYTTWLLIDLHESVPPGIRYSRFMHLSVAAFG